MENRDEMARFYLEACEVEGITCTEESAAYTAEAYEGLGYEKGTARMIELVDDPQGLAGRQLTGAEFDVLDTMDFQISVGSYTLEQRAAVLESGKINSSVVEAILAKNS